MIPWAKPFFGSRERELVIEALDSTWISGGPFVERFEREFAQLHGVEHAVSTSNGTTALQLALIAAGVGPGDEVIVPGFGFLAAANMAIALGASPVFVDVDLDTWCIDPRRVIEAIGPSTKAVVPIHTYGNVSDLPWLRSICDNMRVALVEDVAEAAFSRYRGRLAGTFGDLGCFSFQATKTLTTGEGGMIVTSGEHVDYMRLVRSHGMLPTKHYWHAALGYNFRLTNLQAALGCAQLEQRADILGRKQHVYETYAARLRAIEGLTLQRWTEGAEPVVWAVAAKLDPVAFPRDQVMRQMLEAGVETRPGFYAASQMPLYRQYIDQVPVVAEGIAANVISLPSFPDLSDDEIHRVCDTIEHVRQ